MLRWKVARVMGIDLYVHWSFLLVPVLVLLAFWDHGAPLLAQQQAFYYLCLAFATFGCVILHELGHARMARLFRIRTRDITISFIGGAARLERMSDKPWEEFLIAIAGPAVNVVIACALVVIALPLFVLVGGRTAFQETPATAFIGSLLGINIILVLFNMLPAFPMDGGRVLRALLSLVMDHLRATEMATYVGMAIAMVFGIVGAMFITTWPALLLIALFVFTAGQQELAMTRRRYAMLYEQPIDVIPADQAGPFPKVHVVDPGFSGMAWDVSRRAWVIWHNGRPVSTYGAKPE
jgi:Zn-dependent protease